MSDKAKKSGPAAKLDRLYGVFEAEGKQLYLVGGAVRDHLMGAPLYDMEDLDFATDATPDESQAILQAGSYHTYDVGKRFGTIGTVLRGLRSQGQPTDCQITTFRAAEHYVEGSRHPAVEYGQRLEDDLWRRDFSINSIALTRAGTIVDPYDGAGDIQRRVLRAVGDPMEALGEDPLRILRIARFMSTLGFDADDALRAAAERRAESILEISRERWLQEFNKLLLGAHPAQGLEFLRGTRVLGMILPEVVALSGLHETCEAHHKDLWKHTLQVVEQTERELVQRWVALIHDAGKAWTRRIDEDGRVHFFKHEAHSAMLFEGIAPRFRLDRTTSRAARLVIELHGLVPGYTSQWSDAAVRRLVRRAGDQLGDLLRFARADLTTRDFGRRDERLAAIDELEQRIESLSRASDLEADLPPHMGGAIIERLQLTPGPRVGQLVRMLENAAIDGRLSIKPSVEECIAFVARALDETEATG